MFTGLIQALGIVKSISENSAGKTLMIQCPELINSIAIDDSVATNGVCLTATEIKDDCFSALVMHTSLEKTTTGKLVPGERVNLELAMQMSDRLGGHLVQGHVNGIGQITEITMLGENWNIHIAFPESLRKYMILEGSIAIDGISLTIAQLSDSQLVVSIIPHTLSHTTLRDKVIGSTVNLEVDIMAKYIENFLRYDPSLANAWRNQTQNHD
jgi:riboflavin synthase